MNRIFLSYSIKDYGFARNLQQALHQANMEGFFEADSIPAGADLKEVVREKLRNSSALVVLLSENALSNSWLLFEVGLAEAMGKRIIPIVLPGANIDNSIPNAITDLQVVDARNKPLKDTVEELREIVALGES